VAAFTHVNVYHLAAAAMRRVSFKKLQGAAYEAAAGYEPAPQVFTRL
jgi:hypothetical protein